MDLRVLLLVLCIAFTSVQGAVPKCCVQTSRVPLTILQEVEKFDVQSRHGACDIDALV
ncbi:C-C motif chemokine 27b [Salminus brasiliensis]|uniref:C-C motif chemokine 27b n=1 Tax=Salminus brasiliensis TaxID=930266 RepID=UPI003B82CA68